MAEDPKNPKWQMVCFWISVAVILAVFFIPVETKTIGEGGSVEVRISYTLWDKIAGNGPKDKAELYIDGKQYRKH